MKLRVFSRRLLGIRNPNCVIPGCASTMESTGYMVFWFDSHPKLQGWCIEFSCPEHGIQLSMGGEWQAAIEDAVSAELGPGKITRKL
ncbi:MAG: hypothetical protein GYA21_14675 [Myxococcales bacterium]|nr:hypothetical protein [Myxococcales bacterium]